MTGTKGKIAGVALGALALAGCSGGKTHIKGVPAPAAAKVSVNETDAAFDLLMQGKEDDARKRIKALLKADPMNANARLLSDSIERDPKDLLGPDSYPYTVRMGDTLVGIAQSALGNRLKAYQLLRYNGLKAPATLTAGQVLRLPGEPARSEPVRRSEPAPVRQPVIPAPKPKPAAPAPKPTAPAANPAAARQARAAGLAALNQGNVDRAVGLLRRAATLDPGNPVIGKDLARAERIAATVRAHK